MINQSNTSNTNSTPLVHSTPLREFFEKEINSLTTLNLQQLKSKCRDNNIKVSGNKPEVLERLRVLYTSKMKFYQ